MFNHIKSINDSVWLVPDSKFNEISVSLFIRLPLDTRTAAYTSVLAKLMNDRLEANPTKQSITERLDLMYGARYVVRTYTVGISIILEITARAIHPRFVTEDLLKAQIDLVSDVLNAPLIDSTTFAEAVKNAHQEILRIKESPSYYAITQALTTAAAGQTFGVAPEGTQEDIRAITLESMRTFHQEVLNSYEKNMYIAGDVDETMIPELPRFISGTSVEILGKAKIPAEKVVVSQPSNQTELVLLYETDIDPNHELYIPYLGFIALLGQGTTSLLFQNVREKESLCYSIYASQMIYDGLFYIATSINPKNEARLIELVSQQFNLIQNENLDISSTIAYLANQIDGTTEDLNRLTQFMFRNASLKRSDTPDSLIAQFESLTLDSIRRVIPHIKGPFIYSYRGKDDE